MVAVRSYDDGMAKGRLSEYRAILRTLGLLRELDLGVPLTGMSTFSETAFFKHLKFKSEGRYKTIPSDVIFSSLKNAIEFSLEFGEDLVTSYLTLARNATRANLSLTAYVERYGINSSMTPKVNAMGVKTWHLAGKIFFIENNPQHGSQPGAAVFFPRFRASEGLYELLAVLYGAVLLPLPSFLPPASVFNFTIVSADTEGFPKMHPTAMPRSLRSRKPDA